MTASYRYRAADAAGRVVTGTIEAATATEGREALRRRGLLPMHLAASVEAPARRRAPVRELAMVFRSLAALTSAGMPLDRALGATAPIASAKIAPVLLQARSRLAEGQSLARALDAAGGPIPSAILTVLRAGERAGRLAPTLEHVAQHLEKDAEMIARVRQALAYPMVLVVGGLGSLAVIALVVVPRFADLLGDLGQELPPAARLLMAASTWLVHWWPAILAAGVAALAALLSWTTSPVGRVRLHAILLVVPGLGLVRRSVASERFLRALHVALAAGASLTPALAMARDALGDAELQRRLAASSERVLQGHTLSAALSEANALPPIALQLVAIGEAGGDLAGMTQRAADWLGQDVDRLLQDAVRMLEPVLIVALGAMVAFVAGALLQAVYSLRPAPL